MTDQQTADRLFQTWLDSEAPTATPEGLLDRVDIATRPVRPRPVWVALRSQRCGDHRRDTGPHSKRAREPARPPALSATASLAADATYED